MPLRRCATYTVVVGTRPIRLRRSSSRQELAGCDGRAIDGHTVRAPYPAGRCDRRRRPSAVRARRGRRRRRDRRPARARRRRPLASAAERRRARTRASPGSPGRQRCSAVGRGDDSPLEACRREPDDALRQRVGDREAIRIVRVAGALNEAAICARAARRDRPALAAPLVRARSSGAAAASCASAAAGSATKSARRSRVLGCRDAPAVPAPETSQAPSRRRR